MPPERQPKRQPKTKGVWALPARPGRPKPFGCQWREIVWDEQSKREVARTLSEFFATPQERDARMETIAEDKRRGRMEGISRAELHEWRAFSAAKGAVHWRTVFAGYQAYTKFSGEKPCNISVTDFAKSYLARCAALMNAGEMAEDNERHKRRTVGKFAAAFGHFTLDQLDAKKVEAWMDSLGHNSNATFNSVRKLLFAFLNAAVTEKLIRENPIESIARRRHVVDNREKILTPVEAARLFAFAIDHPRFVHVLGRGALEAFGGVRFSSAYRLDPQCDLDMTGRTFKLPAAKLKTGMHDGISHWVDTTKMPGMETLWEWLALAPKESWELTPRQYLELKSAWFIAAAVRHPQNCLRKSFATYDLAAHANPGRTAYILGHRDQEKLWNDYKGNATRPAAELYQSISPTSARAIAEGAPPPIPDQRPRAPTPPGG